jgi:hypothetical protein
MTSINALMNLYNTLYKNIEIHKQIYSSKVNLSNFKLPKKSKDEDIIKKVNSIITYIKSQDYSNI